MNKKRVVVAMSGGVDSSVCAALLKKKGFEVIGITMRLWDQGKEGRGCCGLSSIDDAKRVAYTLKIPHYVLNFKNIFKEKIVNNFCSEYIKGRTPNPCIRCNQFVKFDALLRRARQIDAEYIATGHYARINYSKATKRFVLKKGIDQRKDQSYFLYTMKQNQLRRTLMPLGEMTKPKVREIAKKIGLSVATKAESQEICFVPDDRYGEFLRKYAPKCLKPGPIINTRGEIIGEHKGIVNYTIGQRKGIGIAYKEPLYVTAIKKSSNVVVVGTKDQVYNKELFANKTNFIYSKELQAPMRVKVGVRYMHTPTWATITPKSRNRVKVIFDEPQWAITPGQAVVFYSKDRVVGGGVIH